MANPANPQPSPRDPGMAIPRLAQLSDSRKPQPLGKILQPLCEKLQDLRGGFYDPACSILPPILGGRLRTIDYDTDGNRVLFANGQPIPRLYAPLALLDATVISRLYLGIDCTSGEFFVIKIRNPPGVGDPDAAGRREHILAELDALRRIADAPFQAPNLVSLTDHGEFENPLDPNLKKEPFLVLPFLEGTSFADVIRKRKLFSRLDKTRIVLGMCRAVEALHALGIIHFDIKPENAMLLHPIEQPLRSGSEIKVKVFDLGICRLFDPADTARPRAFYNPAGTPAYMAPEVLGLQRFNATGAVGLATYLADIYSLGVVLFRAVVGMVPSINQFDQPANMLRLLGEDATKYPSERMVPLPINHIIATAIQANPTQRFQSAGKMRAALEFALSDYTLCEKLANLS